MLSVQETVALQLAADGHTYPKTAAEMGVTINTVHSYLERARWKLNAKDTTHAVALAWRKGLIR